MRPPPFARAAATEFSSANLFIISNDAGVTVKANNVRIPDNELQWNWAWASHGWLDLVYIFDAAEAAFDTVPDPSLHIHDGHFVSVQDFNKDTSVPQGAVVAATRCVRVPLQAVGDGVPAHRRADATRLVRVWSKRIKLGRVDCAIASVLSTRAAILASMRLVPLVAARVGSRRRRGRVERETSVCRPALVKGPDITAVIANSARIVKAGIRKLGMRPGVRFVRSIVALRTVMKVAGGNRISMPC